METSLVQIRNFSEPSPDKWEVMVPEGAAAKDIVLNNNGIYIFYEIPSIKTGKDEKHTYVVIGPGNPVPLGASYFRMAELTIPQPDGSMKHLIMPIYRILH